VPEAGDDGDNEEEAGASVLGLASLLGAQLPGPRCIRVVRATMASPTALPTPRQGVMASTTSSGCASSGLNASHTSRLNAASPS
jgi:hypothetical protein